MNIAPKKKKKLIREILQFFYIKKTYEKLSEN